MQNMTLSSMKSVASTLLADSPMQCHLAQAAHDSSAIRHNSNQPSRTKVNWEERKFFCTNCCGGRVVPAKREFLCEVTGGSRETIDDKLKIFAGRGALKGMRDGMWYTFDIRRPPDQAPVKTRLAVICSRPDPGCGYVGDYLRTHLLFQEEPPAPADMKHCLEWENMGLSFTAYAPEPDGPMLNRTNTTLCVEKARGRVVLAIPGKYLGPNERMRNNAKGKSTGKGKEKSLSESMPVTKLMSEIKKSPHSPAHSALRQNLGSPSSFTRSQCQLKPVAAATTTAPPAATAMQPAVAVTAASQSHSPFSEGRLQLMGSPFARQ